MHMTEQYTDVLNIKCKVEEVRAVIIRPWIHVHGICLKLRQGFSISTLVTVGAGEVFVVGLSCALQKCRQHPGLYPLNVSRTFQVYLQVSPNVLLRTAKLGRRTK